MGPHPFIPHDLPINALNWERLSAFTSQATIALGRYGGTLEGMVNPEILLSPIANKEAVLSSRIEGTIASLEEVLQHEAGQEYDEHKKGDIKEIINYRRALLAAEHYLTERPITLHLIRSLHEILMQDVRGGDRTPGCFRTDQNWIGKPGSRVEQARFVPPEPLVMQAHLDKLQHFIESDYNDPLVQLALIHAQFEIIHPFNDGNGRMGRMLIPLFLCQKQVLQRPVFYLSEYLEASDQEYRDRLLAITAQNDWQGWVEFFLKAIHVQANRNNDKAKRIHTLYEKMKKAFVEATKSQYAQGALDAFFRKPILNSTDFARLTDIPIRSSANNILKALLEHQLIHVLRQGAGRAPTIYSFPGLLEIVE